MILDGGTNFLKFPRPSTPDKPDINPNHLAPLKNHGSEYSPLVSTSKILFGCGDVLGVFPASNNKTLKLSLFFHPHSTDFYHVHLLNEDHDKQNSDNGSVLQKTLVMNCKHGTQDVCMVNMVRKYYSMCETVESVHAAVETQRRILC
jgi:hypothetical protein